MKSKSILFDAMPNDKPKINHKHQLNIGFLKVVDRETPLFVAKELEKLP